MPRTLRLSVHFHDGRYHGTGPWPPAPARLFQALVAAAAVGGRLGEHEKAWEAGDRAARCRIGGATSLP